LSFQEDTVIAPRSGLRHSINFTRGKLCFGNGICFRPQVKRQGWRLILSNRAEMSRRKQNSSPEDSCNMHATIEKLCFLCGPCRDVISKGRQLIVSSVRESVKTGLSRRQRNSHCYSRYQETSSNRLRTRALVNCKLRN
jgi:hypothetical protein